jgi:hypothetical protein
MDVGTNIDCRAWETTEAKYKLYFVIERSWVEDGDSAEKPRSSPDERPAKQPPIVRQFKAETWLNLRDGRSIETNFATDPVSGKVIKVEISLNVVK